MPSPLPTMPFAGLELLSSAVVFTDETKHIIYVNAGAENLFSVSERKLIGQTLSHLLGSPLTLLKAIERALNNNWSYTEHGFIAHPPDNTPPLHLDCTITPIDAPGARLLFEFRPIEAQLRVVREEQRLQQQQASRELIRNLAHEIKNPLGGIRGSAQLLERELQSPALHEYTQVIIAEADRLQDLMSRLLYTHQGRRPAPLNIHDVLEHVRRLILAEYEHITVIRDYDISLPPLMADREQLIQAILNICRNAAQALEGKGNITLRTRVARQMTLAKRRYKLVLLLQIIDNGPGIPKEIQDRIFYPLVSGRQGGSGLGLSVAQNIIEQHQGMIEVHSQPGQTNFSLLLPLNHLTEATSTPGLATQVESTS